MASNFTPDPDEEEAHRLSLARLPAFVLHGSRENVDASRAAVLVEESLSQLSQDIANLAAAATVAVSHEDSSGGEGARTASARAARMTCRRVQLSNKSLSEEAAIVVAKALLQLGQDVEHADISDIIAGKHEVEALKVLEIGQMRVEAGRRQ